MQLLLCVLRVRRSSGAKESHAANTHLFTYRMPARGIFPILTTDEHMHSYINGICVYVKTKMHLRVPTRAAFDSIRVF